MNNLITISSVVAESVATNEQQIVARWKSTEKKEISPNNRARAVILPANIWSATSELTAIKSNNNLSIFLHDAIEDLARSYLSTICEESNWQRTEVPLSHFTLSKLLEWNNEQAAMRGRLNAAEITNWLSQSVTISKVSAAHGAAIATALGAQLVKLASPNHGLTSDKATKILANLWQEDDAESITGMRVQLRLTSIANRAQQEQDLLASIL